MTPPMTMFFTCRFFACIISVVSFMWKLQQVKFTVKFISIICFWRPTLRNPLPHVFEQKEVFQLDFGVFLMSFHSGAYP